MQKAVVVTGGASGIGLAVARTLKARGWAVCLVDRSEAGLAEACGSSDIRLMICVLLLRSRSVVV